METNKEDKKLLELSEKMRQKEIDKANALINSVFTTIVEDVEEFRGVMPEIVFKEYFLDYFKNIKVAENNALLLKWLEISGGPYNKVDIIDGDGNVIFTVPSIMNRPKVDDKMLDNIDMYNMTTTFTMKAEVLHSSAIMYLQTELANLPDAISNDIKEDIMVWKQIIARYNQPTVNKELPQNKASIFASDPVEIDDDMLDYD